MNQPIGDVVIIAICGAIILACNVFGLLYKPRIFVSRANHHRAVAFMIAVAAAFTMLFLVIARHFS